MFTIRKVTGEGGENDEKNNAREGDWKKKTNVQRRSKEKKILQSELDCQAYKLYPTPQPSSPKGTWQPLYTALC